MPVSLLDLPYELREQILTLLLMERGSVKLQRPIERPAIYTPSISQVCQLLREEAVRIFYYVNTFTWTIDPEATFLTNEATGPPTNVCNSRISQSVIPSQLSMLPWHHASALKGLRHLRLDLYLPDPYNQKLWLGDLATQLKRFVESVDNGHKLKDLKILIMTWHCFRDLADWQADILGLLDQMTMRGYIEVRARSLDGKLRANLQKLDLTNKIRDCSVSCSISPSDECHTVGSQDLDWEWEGGVVV